MNNLKKRCLTLLLSLAMIVTYMPVGMIAYAEDDPAAPQNEQLVDAGNPVEEVTSDDTGSKDTVTEEVKSDDVKSNEAAKPAEKPAAKPAPEPERRPEPKPAEKPEPKKGFFAKLFGK